MTAEEPLQGEQDMKIAIVGAGVLGTIFSSLFEKCGFDVTLIEVMAERIDLIRREGLSLTMPDGSVAKTAPRITANPGQVGHCDVVMVCVKGYHTKSAIDSAKPMIGPSTMVLSVQNGLGNLETIAQAVGEEKVVGGITAHSGMPISLNEVRYVGGLGPLLVVGPLGKTAPAPFDAFVDRLKNSGLMVECVDDIQKVMWKKLIANVSTNCIAAITGLTGGKAVEHEPTVKMIGELACEVAAVAKAKGLSFPELDDPLAFALKAFASTKDNKVSMLQDIEAGRPTEIGSLNEVIAAEGDRLGVPTPFNKTVTLLVRGLEEKNRLGQQSAA